MYKVYILESVLDKSRYTGVTINLVNRLKEHNSGETKSNKPKIPYKIIWYCAFSNKFRAYEFERYLKSSSGHAFTKKTFYITTASKLSVTNSLNFFKSLNKKIIF